MRNIIHNSLCQEVENSLFLSIHIDRSKDVNNKINLEDLHPIEIFVNNEVFLSTSNNHKHSR